jgi:serine/threonine protein phosphatase 1
MSDVHGLIVPYLKMLEMIQLSPDDTLYIIGDVIDRGKHGVKILQHIMKHDNIILLRGNHEDMMLEELIGKAVRSIFSGNLWYGNGGEPTDKAYRALPTEEQQVIHDFLKKTPTELHIQVAPFKYHLVHGRPSTHEYDEDFLWHRFDLRDVKEYNGNGEIVIFGHTPTIGYRRRNPMKIFFGGKCLIGIDCGCAYGKRPGQLGCLRLDDWKEYYCDIKEAR